MSDKKFYVYVHLYASGPKVGQVFYVGKGHGKRLNWKFSRNPHWNSVVNKYGFDTKIVMRFANENCAFSFEVALIKFYGRDNLTNKTDGGDGVSGLKMSDDSKKLMREIKLGKPNLYARNDTVHKFNHDDHGSILATHHHMVKEFGLNHSNLSKMISGERRKVGGWWVGDGCKPTMIGKNNPSYDQTLYRLTHEDYGTIITTKFDFRNKYNLNHSSVSELISGKRKSHKGWTLCSE